MKITLAQINPTVGDLKGNLKKIEQIVKEHHDQTDLIVFPELVLTGYPPRDLLLEPWFICNIDQAINQLIQISKENPSVGFLIGLPTQTKQTFGKLLYNSALLFSEGKIIFRQHKKLLPTYDVFDEHRYFEPSQKLEVIPFKNQVLGITICEDVWKDEMQYRTKDPVEELIKKGATMIINLAASPFHLTKENQRLKIFQDHIAKHQCPMLFVNQVGGNDELIFDGKSFCLNNKGKVCVQLPAFEESVQTFELENIRPIAKQDVNLMQDLEDALILGIRDYFHKCGAKKAVLGLSGGIDSAVACVLAVKALGKDNVLGLSMPSPYSSQGSKDDAKKLTDNLNIELQQIDISKIYQSYKDIFKETFQGRKEDVTEENIQARIRGNLLMAYSNKLGCLVLTTGNKSELAVGYCTLYGDMSGGLAVISDVPKTMVYSLANFMNKDQEIIPLATIKKPPSAELRPNQLDEDSLPPYDRLDKILNYYIEEHLSIQAIVDKGFDKDEVQWIVSHVNRNEYKRRQACPGLKVTSKAFGVGRRMPVASYYEENV